MSASGEHRKHRQMSYSYDSDAIDSEEKLNYPLLLRFVVAALLRQMWFCMGVVRDLIG